MNHEWRLNYDCASNDSDTASSNGTLKYRETCTGNFCNSLRLYTLIHTRARAHHARCIYSTLQTLKKLASTIAPIYKHFIDESLITGTIPSDLKHSIISPLIKKPKLDCNTLSNYRPISQLTILTKLLEKVIYKQLILYLTANDILDPQQSAFRKLHSTETTILSLLDDLLNSLTMTFQHNYCF